MERRARVEKRQRARARAPAGGRRGRAELTDDERELLTAHRADVVELERALAALPEDDLLASLQRVAEAVVLAASVEAAIIRVRDADRDRDFHLIASEGISASELSMQGMDPLPMATMKALLALGPHHSYARRLGFAWLHGEWLIADGQAIGCLIVASRTRRRPADAGRALLARTAPRLSKRLTGIDRSAAALVRISRRLARETVVRMPTYPSGPLAGLRPRERTVLGLYTDDMEVDEIAEILVISPHTVRTHIKNAFRRLGVHSREEAGELVHAQHLEHHL